MNTPALILCGVVCLFGMLMLYRSWWLESWYVGYVNMVDSYNEIMILRGRQTDSGAYFMLDRFNHALWRFWIWNFTALHCNEPYLFKICETVKDFDFQPGKFLHGPSGLYCEFGVGDEGAEIHIFHDEDDNIPVFVGDTPLEASAFLRGYCARRT